ncbi:hypothetical protein BV20DRAFT_65419 [Pilatotrama ljubarskyi]|nr:hypothetical protein BV20DRAFT_65419 [Pilatotrama ljubarskyi]
MSFEGQIGGLVLPAASHSSPPSPSPGNRVPPPLPPRPSRGVVPPATNEEVGLNLEDDEATTPAGSDPLEASTPTENFLTPKEEEQLSEVQLRELYDDEEIERFLYLFSTYVREVRAPVPRSVAHAASASAPALSETLSPGVADLLPKPTEVEQTDAAPRSLSERIAIDYFLPLLPPPRPPPPAFSLGRLKDTAQRLYVALEPLYSLFVIPLLRLATWQDPRRSFVYCALYWILWYHGFLTSALLLRVLYSLVRRKLHPYPSLDELRAHRSRIGRSHTFSAMLSSRLATSPWLGVKDVWDLFREYRQTQKLKKAAKSPQNTGESEQKTEGDDAASVHSIATEKPEETHEQHSRAEDLEEEDLKRLGLYALCEIADLLERIKNIFLWRNPSASTVYGAILFGWFLLGLLPAQYVVRSIGFVAGAFFWHVVPIMAAIPPSQRSRIPPPLSSVPTDAEYAMDLISQRVARGLPVRPKRRKARRGTSDSVNVAGAEKNDAEGSKSSSVDWNKFGDRLASTKERTGELRKILRDGQWKQPENWMAALNPLAPKVATPQGGSEERIETHTFPAQLKQHPGLITLTPTTVFFTPLLAARATLSIPLADVTRVKKSGITKGIDIGYSEPRADGSREEKEVKFFFVGSRDDLFARLVSWGGKRWTNV